MAKKTDELTIGEAREVLAQAEEVSKVLCASPQVAPADGSRVGLTLILVLQRGWVVVGKCSRDDAEMVQLQDASVIRQWGTTKGLGEIALNGPTSKTVLDVCGTVEVHPLAVVLVLRYKGEKWPD